MCVVYVRRTIYTIHINHNYNTTTISIMMTTTNATTHVTANTTITIIRSLNHPYTQYYTPYYLTITLSPPRASLYALTHKSPLYWCVLVHLYMYTHKFIIIIIIIITHTHNHNHLTSSLTIESMRDELMGESFIDDKSDMQLVSWVECWELHDVCDVCDDNNTYYPYQPQL
jgi:hypothetical protein